MITRSHYFKVLLFVLAIIYSYQGVSQVFYLDPSKVNFVDGKVRTTEPMAYFYFDNCSNLPIKIKSTKLDGPSEVNGSFSTYTLQFEIEYLRKIDTTWINQPLWIMEKDDIGDNDLVAKLEYNVPRRKKGHVKKVVKRFQLTCRNTGGLFGSRKVHAVRPEGGLRNLGEKKAKLRIWNFLDFNSTCGINVHRKLVRCD